MGYHAHARFEATHIGADFGDISREFMTKQRGWFNNRMPAAVGLNIGAAS
jgi:hypothetical protein